MERRIIEDASAPGNVSGSTATRLLLPAIAALLLVTLTALTRHEAIVVHGPRVQSPTPESVILRWQTDRPTASAVRFGTAGEETARLARRRGKYTNHEVRLDRLEPDTDYWFRVGPEHHSPSGDSRAPAMFRTSPPIASNRSFRVCVAGDMTTRGRAGAATRALANRAAEADLILWLGDTAVQSRPRIGRHAARFIGPTEFTDLLSFSGHGRAVPLWATPGDHGVDAAGSDAAAKAFARTFSFPAEGEAGGVRSESELYYAFDHANVHFICLDSVASDRAPLGGMMTWLENDLADTRQTWIVAFWHHPPHEPSCNDPAHRTAHHLDAGRARDMRENALPLLERAGADLVLFGHGIGYTRAYRSVDPDAITNSNPFPTPNRTDVHAPIAPVSDHPDPGPAATRDGTVYLTIGSGGACETETTPGFHRASEFNGPGVIELEFRDRHLIGTFTDERGQVQDRFAIDPSRTQR